MKDNKLMDKALILGVGNAQVDAIHYLKSRDWYVIGCSYKNEGPGLSLVNQFSLTNIIDVEAVETLAKKEKVKFIYSVGSDIAMPVIVKASNNLGLPSFLSVDQTEKLVNKGKLREALEKSSISQIAFRRIKGLSDIRGWRTYPAILKPVDSQGSRGVFFIEKIDDLYQHYEEALHYSWSKTAIIEEFLDGPETEAIVIVKNQKLIFSIISDRLTVPEYQTGIPKGHRIPSLLSNKEERKITNDLIKRTIQSLDIDNGPLYFQFKLTHDGPKILEIGPRLDGGHIWLLIKHYCNVDVLDMTFRLLMSDEIPIIKPQPKFKFAQLDFTLQPPGEKFDSSLVKLPKDFLVYQSYYSDGQIVSRVNGILEKTGYCIWGKPD
jgi:phosphoribosylamine-glycine ligase